MRRRGRAARNRPTAEESVCVIDPPSGSSQTVLTMSLFNACTVTTCEVRYPSRVMATPPGSDRTSVGEKRGYRTGFRIPGSWFRGRFGGMGCRVQVFSFRV